MLAKKSVWSCSWSWSACSSLAVMGGVSSRHFPGETATGQGAAAGVAQAQVREPQVYCSPAKKIRSGDLMCAQGCNNSPQRAKVHLLLMMYWENTFHNIETTFLLLTSLSQLRQTGVAWDFEWTIHCTCTKSNEWDLNLLFKFTMLMYAEKSSYSYFSKTSWSFIRIFIAWKPLGMLWGNISNYYSLLS